jgi:hypothetical protein
MAGSSPAMTTLEERTMTKNTDKQDKEEKLPEAAKPETAKLRPIGLDAGKVVIHDSFFDPLPDGFSGID